MVNPRHTAIGWAAAALLVTGSADAQADEVVRWNQVATDTMARNELDPLTESRMLAILHLAMHDAVNAIERRYETFRRTTRLVPQASADAAVAAAAHTTLLALMPKERAAFDFEWARTMAEIGDEAASHAGTTVGRKAALSVLSARADDGAADSVVYQPGTMAGAYRPTPPDYTAAAFAHWGQVAPFALVSASQFRPAPPPLPGSVEALRDIAEVRDIGIEKSSIRTEEQSQVARFWYENSTQGWNRIMREVARTSRFDRWETARLFALVNVAMADGFIAGFEAKYHYNYWRPATAIRSGGAADWLSYLVTPPVPDYPSTHTVLGAAAATVLARVFGTDFIEFSMTSGAPYPGITRRFWSFSAAARENGASRVLAGIHFATAVSAGYEQGSNVGEFVFETMLRPVATVATSEQTAAVR